VLCVDVQEVGSKCVGGAELAVHKGKLQSLSDETHGVLKKNVFQHYEQFIETAKDISCKILSIYCYRRIIICKDKG